MKIYKLLSVIFSVILCLCLILTTTACKNQENVSSEEYEIVYEYLEESGSDLSSDTSNKNSNSDEDDKTESSKPSKEENKTQSSTQSLRIMINNKRNEY